MSNRVQVACSGCGTKYKVSFEKVNKGSKATCKKCNTRFELRTIADDPTVPRQRPGRKAAPIPEPALPEPAPDALIAVAIGNEVQRYTIGIGTISVGGPNTSLPLPGHQGTLLTLSLMPDGKLVLQAQVQGVNVNGRPEQLAYVTPGDNITIADVQIMVENPGDQESVGDPPTATEPNPEIPSPPEPIAQPSPQRSPQAQAPQPAPPPQPEPDTGPTAEHPRDPAPAEPPPTQEQAIQRPPPQARQEGLGSEEQFEFFEEEDEDELDFEEPFSMAEELLKHRDAPEAQRESYVMVDVLRLVEGRVQGTEQLKAGNRYASADDGVRCEMVGERANLSVLPGYTGNLDQGGQRFDVSAAVVQDGRHVMSMGDGDEALVSGPNGDFAIRVYHPVAPPRRGGLSLSPMSIAFVMLAIVFHGVIIVTSDNLRPEKIEVETEEGEIFAEVKMELEQPKPPKVKPKPKDATKMAERAPAVTTRAVAKAQQKQTSASVENLVKLLAKGSGAKGATTDLKDNISNIDAVKGGVAASSFDIAGAIGSLGENAKVNVARSGGGGVISTMGSEDVKATTSIGEAKKGGVRGKVTKLSSQARVQGSLAREDVLRVINKNSHKVQACYEKGLMQAGEAISGKIAMEWVVSTSGGVKNARVKSSTMANPAIAQCITNEIKRWQFPQPEGGEVTIVFPWIFRSM